MGCCWNTRGNQKIKKEFLLKRYSLFGSFFTALAFLTRIPAPEINIPLSRSFAFFPLIGLLIGGLNLTVLYVFNWLLPYFIVGYAGVAFDAWITRGLHLDGFADWIDALGGGFTIDRRLEILKDSNLGSFAVIGLIICIAIRAGAFSELISKSNWLPIVFAPGFSRFAMVVMVPGMASARSGKGLGGKFIEDFRMTSIWISLVFIIPLAFVHIKMFLVMTFLTLSVVAWSRWLYKKKFGGLTGDLFGATCVITETLLLIASASLLWW